VLTTIAYTAMALVAAWWFWRTQADVIKPALHVVVSIIFGLLWPVSFPWHVLVRTVSRAIARYRMRRMDPSVDEQIKR
jgi:hypothetical protein